MNLTIAPDAYLSLPMYVSACRECVNEHREETGQGLGFLPAVAAAPVIAPAIAGVIGAVAGAVGSFFSGIFGGDDQRTSYRPPPNAAQMAANIGGQLVSYDLSDLSTAISRGNRVEDIYSYYSAFALGNTSQASPAASTVIRNLASSRGVSIREAGSLLLDASGVRRIVSSFLPSGQKTTQAPALPPYCPVGSYHPFPIGHPQQNVCVPFPPPPPSSSGGQAPTAQTAQQTAQQTGQGVIQAVAGAAAGGAGQIPIGMVQDPRTGAWVIPPPCPQGQSFDFSTGQCAPGLLSGLLSFQVGGFPAWLLLLLLALVASSGGDSREVRFRRRS